MKFCEVGEFDDDHGVVEVGENVRLKRLLRLLWLVDLVEFTWLV